MVVASELKPGMVIRLEGQIYKVLEVEVKAGAAKTSGVVKLKLRNITSDRLWEPHFRPEERLEELELEQRPMEFLFAGDDSCTFMNLENFEQVEIPRTLLGEAAQFLQSGTQLPVEFFSDQPISVVVPDVFEARVSRTAPSTHSPQDSAWKEAVLENGIRIRVPLFVGPGEVVRVDWKRGRYIERARTERRRSA